MLAILVITNELTHPVPEIQPLTPSVELAEALAHEGRRVILFGPLGTLKGRQLRDIVGNLTPKQYKVGNATYLFPPALTSGPTTPLVTFSSAFFLLANILLRRIKLEGMYTVGVVPGIVGALVGATLGTPFVMNYGDPEYARVGYLGSLFILLFEKLVRNTAKAVLCIDPVEATHLERRLGRRCTGLLPAGGFRRYANEDSSEWTALVEEVRRRYGLADKKVVLYAGHISRRPHRLDVLVDAAPKVIQERPDAVFAVSGDGPWLPEFVKRVSRLGIEDRFVFTGPLPPRELGALLSLADVGVQVLNDMCGGAKIMTYMSYGVPVVSACPWHEEYRAMLLSGENCLLAGLDANDLANAIIRLLEDSGFGKRVGGKGEEFARKYAWDTQAKYVLSLMEPQ